MDTGNTTDRWPGTGVGPGRGATRTWSGEGRKPEGEIYLDAGSHGAGAKGGGGADDVELRASVWNGVSGWHIYVIEEATHAGAGAW